MLAVTVMMTDKWHNAYHWPYIIQDFIGRATYTCVFGQGLLHCCATMEKALINSNKINNDKEELSVIYQHIRPTCFNCVLVAKGAYRNRMGIGSHGLVVWCVLTICTVTFRRLLNALFIYYSQFNVLVCSALPFCPRYWVCRYVWLSMCRSFWIIIWVEFYPFYPPSLGLNDSSLPLPAYCMCMYETKFLFSLTYLIARWRTQRNDNTHKHAHSGHFKWQVLDILQFHTRTRLYVLLLISVTNVKYY